LSVISLQTASEVVVNVLLTSPKHGGKLTKFDLTPAEPVPAGGRQAATNTGRR
jgi:hypothetical protein